MENVIEEYKKQFQSEELELIVRISWSWEKGCSEFGTLGNFYKAHARFDKAIDAKTGEMLEAGIGFYWLEWLAPKKMFGFKYAYKLKKDNIYRVLVREHITNENEKSKKYYLEQVLEANVNEPRMNPLYSFESGFEEEIMDLSVLIKRRITSGIIEAGYRTPKVVFWASIDEKSNQLKNFHGTLTWMESDKKINTRFKFDDMTSYCIRVRKSRKDNNSYMLLDVIKKITDDRLEGIKEQYLKPVIINNEFGEFRLDKDYNWFTGHVNYFDEKCSVYMNVNEGETTVDIQLDKLKEIFSNLNTWDGTIKEYASNELLQTADEWNDEETEITQEQFIQRLGVPAITIDTNGAMEVMFGDDGMFAGHSILIDIDENGNLRSADIVG